MVGITNGVAVDGEPHVTDQRVVQDRVDRAAILDPAIR